MAEPDEIAGKLVAGPGPGVTVSIDEVVERVTERVLEHIATREIAVTFGHPVFTGAPSESDRAEILGRGMKLALKESEVRTLTARVERLRAVVLTLNPSCTAIASLHPGDLG